MKKRIALIFGISGQDGTYLANFLLKKKYLVIGITRNISNQNLFKIKKMNIKKKLLIYENKKVTKSFLKKILHRSKKINEIYYLSGETSPLKSIAKPIETIENNVLSIIKILEFIRLSSKKTKFFYASSSEIFEKNKKNVFDENSKFGPRSPYGISKASGQWFVKFYRQQYNIFCCSGILFNHESPLRSKNFIFKKIIDFAKKLKKSGGKIHLGNINVERDIGWAPDYVIAFWKMLQLKKATDFVIGSGKKISIKTFLDLTFNNLKISKKNIIFNKKKLLRKNDLTSYRSNPSLAKRKLKWSNTLGVNQIVKKMINDELY